MHDEGAGLVDCLHSRRGGQADANRAGGSVTDRVNACPLARGGWGRAAYAARPPLATMTVLLLGVGLVEVRQEHRIMLARPVTQMV
ncbi:hypothetical protein GCM10009608_12660 [Pseudonocardia alaniniphila]